MAMQRSAMKSNGADERGKAILGEGNAESGNETQWLRNVKNGIARQIKAMAMNDRAKHSNAKALSRTDGQCGGIVVLRNAGALQRTDEQRIE